MPFVRELTTSIPTRIFFRVGIFMSFLFLPKVELADHFNDYPQKVSACFNLRAVRHNEISLVRRGFVGGIHFNRRKP